MQQIDPDKEWRLQRETEMFDLNFIDNLGERLLRFLEKKTNKEIFADLKGQLFVTIPTGGNANARVTIPKGKPLEPTIEIRLALVLDIYRDSFALPLISKRILNETTALEVLNKEMRKGADFTFDSAMPEISVSQLIGPLYSYAIAMAKIIENQGDARIDKNDVYCRFLMFEIMVAWTFFHELSHVLQQHRLVRERLGEANAQSEHINELNNDTPSDTNLFGQAREILADAEAIHLTLEYLAQGERLNYATAYLLLCGISCMFQQFYNSHEDHLGVVAGQHPHPVIRDEFAQVTILNWINSYLLKRKSVSNKEQAAIPLVYLNVRASVITGMYRAHRIEKTDNKLPSYMALQSKENDAQRRSYMQTLAKHITQQLPLIHELHLTSADVLTPLIQFVEKLEKEAGECANADSSVTTV